MSDAKVEQQDRDFAERWSNSRLHEAEYAALAHAHATGRAAGYSRGLREGAAEALAALRETLKGTLDWRDEHTNYGKAVRHTMQYVDAAIRARSEGGKA